MIMARIYLLLMAIILQSAGPAHAQQNADDLICVPPTTQVFNKPTCSWTKEISPRCNGISKDSIFSQCNVFDLSLDRAQTRYDDNSNTYTSAIFKYSETNTCGTGDNATISLLGRCDTFAAYVQVFRNQSSNKCYALVNSALLGVQPMEFSRRNDPDKHVTKVEIPGVSRRIIFTPSDERQILSQASGVLIRAENNRQSLVRSGQALSHLYLLELESPLTTREANLKPDPAKIRISRGVNREPKDFFDISLNRGQEQALNQVLSSCS
jgi:hypothetical protein